MRGENYEPQERIGLQQIGSVGILEESPKMGEKYMNPATIMKMMSAKAQFEKNHPKFMSFVKTVFSRPIEEGTVLEITVTRPGEEPVTANIKVLQSDLDLLENLKELAK